MRTIKIEDLNQEMEVTEAEQEHVQGGVLIGLLLPAVQKVRETAVSDTLNTRWGGYVQH